MSEPTTHADATAPNGWPWALLRGFREGRREALSEVYHRHADEVTKQLRYGFAFQAAGRHHRFVGCRSAFELHDALHETFRRAFEPVARERYDGLRPYGPYLRAIARNVVLRGFRAREVQFPEVRADGESTAGPIEIVDEGSATPEQHVGRAEVRAVVGRFLQTLPPDDRRLLEVRFVEGKSQRDAAEVLGLGRQQIRGREAKLRQQMLRFLRAEGEEGLVAAGLSLPLPLLGPSLLELLGEVMR
ncbi:RNA polymerase sigma factor [Paraliomyxa miuraensis]|uniref:RNA polymerase sigma factor n=1 Tax=Paraliomyxa miuraensis TaxID=376150 RepID=UPI002254D20A|nr:sigma-70 family RNA polymerase sigma factor [Paraliomyxa miuraensis]MCX4244401.1 sigma-70 family RNA polymerase sigma factor [Paraliomyxa miuraensis]